MFCIEHPGVDASRGCPECHADAMRTSYFDVAAVCLRVFGEASTAQIDQVLLLLDGKGIQLRVHADDLKPRHK